MKQQVIIKKVGLISLVLGLFIVTFSPLYGQCRLDKTQHQIYKYNDASLKYIEYIFSNGTLDTVYLWIDDDSIGENSMTLEQKNIWYFQKYLRYPKCELGLVFLCHDGNIRYSEGFPPTPVIGCTFIKKVLPNESFTIISLNENIGEEAIHYVKQNIVSHYFSVDNITRFCYDKPFILVL